MNSCYHSSKWLGVIYGDTCDKEKFTKRQPYFGDCKSGWVYSPFIRINDNKSSLILSSKKNKPVNKRSKIPKGYISSKKVEFAEDNFLDPSKRLAKYKTDKVKVLRLSKNYVDTRMSIFNTAYSVYKYSGLKTVNGKKKIINMMDNSTINDANSDTVKLYKFMSQYRQIIGKNPVNKIIDKHYYKLYVPKHDGKIGKRLDGHYLCIDDFCSEAPFYLK